MIEAWKFVCFLCLCVSTYPRKLCMCVPTYRSLSAPTYLYVAQIFEFISVYCDNFCHQESIPTVTAEKVKAGMLEGVEAALGLPKGSLKKPFYTRVQLW